MSVQCSLLCAPCFNFSSLYLSFCFHLLIFALLKRDFPFSFQYYSFHETKCMRKFITVFAARLPSWGGATLSYFSVLRLLSGLVVLHVCCTDVAREFLFAIPSSLSCVASSVSWIPYLPFSLFISLFQ